MSLPYPALYNLARDLCQPNSNLRELMQTALTHAREIIGATQGGFVAFYDENAIQDALILGTDDLDDTDMEYGFGSRAIWEILLRRGLVGYVVHTQRTVTLHNIATDPRWPKLPQLFTSIPVNGSAVGLPLPRGGKISGVMLFLHPEVAFFDEEIVTILEEIAHLAADALNNALDLRGHDVHQRYYTLFDNAVVPILLTDLQGRIIDINRQASHFLGKMPNAVVNKAITTLHDIDLETLCDGKGLSGIGVDEEVSIRTTILTHDGKEVPAYVRLRHLVVEGYHVIEWIEQDISAQVELEQLRQDLSAMVYHDLRGPLHSLQASVHKLSQVLANHEDPAIWTLLQVGVRSARQLNRMVDSLLDLQRLEEGNNILNVEDADLHRLLADAVALVQPLAVEAALRLKFELQTSLPTISLDRDMMMRVVVNLLENAVKYTPSGGIITVIAYSDPDKVTIRVRDNGPGIPPEMRDSIFDKFSRVKYQKAPKGLGLGLAFCRLAVHAHGGQIWVESELGNGSDFVLTLPLVNAPTPESQAKPQATLKTQSLATTA